MGLNYFARLALIVYVSLFAFDSKAQETASAVSFKGVTYVALVDVVHRDFLNGKSELVDHGRTIDVTTSETKIQFVEGGDRVVSAEGTTVPLKSPVLVLDGVHFIPVKECSRFLGFE